MQNAAAGASSISWPHAFPGPYEPSSNRIVTWTTPTSEITAARAKMPHAKRRRSVEEPPSSLIRARYPGSTCGFEGERLRAGPGASTTYRGRWIPSGSTFDQSMPAHGS